MCMKSFFLQREEAFFIYLINHGLFIIFKRQEKEA